MRGLYLTHAAKPIPKVAYFATRNAEKTLGMSSLRTPCRSANIIKASLTSGMGPLLCTPSPSSIYVSVSDFYSIAIQTIDYWHPVSARACTYVDISAGAHVECSCLMLALLEHPVGTSSSLELYYYYYY